MKKAEAKVEAENFLNLNLFIDGGVAEWTMAAVLKTVV